MNKKKRFAAVGVGNRARTFVDALARNFAADSELVGICDTNPGRLEYFNRRLVGELSYHVVPTYTADRFGRMLKEQKPDTVIVASTDATHHTYIAQALDAGCDAVSEKPMTIDVPGCRTVFEAVKRTGRNVRVTFNMRWRPGSTLLKQLLLDGVIGNVLQADMEYTINTRHGADYFRRWHRDKRQSGGLIIHKSTHHFDLVNWLIDSVPETVFGVGRLAFYGRENAERRGVVVGADRYTGHASPDDPFALDLTADRELKEMYYDQEHHDGYRRDQNVFGDGITAEDSMGVLVQYRSGVLLNYSINAFSPREGFTLTLTGDRGRIEYSNSYGHHIAGESEVPQLESRCIVNPMFKSPYEVPVPEATGSHGGSDDLLTEQIFSGNPPADPFRRSAGHGQGAASLLIGAAANESFATRKVIQISEFFPELGSTERLSDLP